MRDGWIDGWDSLPSVDRQHQTSHLLPLLSSPLLSSFFFSYLSSPLLSSPLFSSPLLFSPLLFSSFLSFLFFSFFFFSSPLLSSPLLSNSSIPLPLFGRPSDRSSQSSDRTYFSQAWSHTSHRFHEHTQRTPQATDFNFWRGMTDR